MVVRHTVVFDNKQGVAENLQSAPIAEEDGRKFKIYIYIDLILKIIVF